MKKIEDRSGIVYACYSQTSRAGEQFIEEHGVSFILSGSMVAFDGEGMSHFKAGDIILYRKNTLAKFVKQPDGNKPFESVSVILDKDLLWEFNQSNEKHHSDNQCPVSSFYPIPGDKLLVNYFETIQLLFNEAISEKLILVKKQEMIMLLLRNNPELKDILFDFSMPGKIDLEAFMNQNFKFNVSLPQLAYLTGRSLASFKRDFVKIFHLSPNRWVQHKRLQEAYYLLSEKKMKPKDVFADVGFETLSHFSFAFKQQFGINPSSV